jgi:hypothetical protein
MLVSLSPVISWSAPPREQATQCCKNHAPAQSIPKKDCDGGGNCPMHCCRIHSAPADAAPELVERTRVVPFNVFSPMALHSLTDPEAIFHPPRA